MKTKWSKFEILVTCLSVAIIPLAARLVSIVPTLIFAPSSLLLTYISLSSLFLTPLIGATALVRFLRMRGKHVWPASIVLTVLLVLLGLAAKYLWEFTKFIKPLTGHSNAEAIGFYLLFLILLCSGALLGIGVGVLLSKRPASMAAGILKGRQD